MLGYLVELSPVLFVLVVAFVKTVGQVRGGAGLRDLVRSNRWKPREDREKSGMTGRNNKAFRLEENVKSTKITSLTEV